MRTHILMAGAAALAMVVPANAKPDGGGGGGHSKGQHVQHSGGGHGQGGGAKAQRGGGGNASRMQHVERGGGGPRGQTQRTDRGPGRFANFQAERGQGGGKARNSERGSKDQRRFESRGQRELRAESRGNGTRQARMENRAVRDREVAQTNRGNQRIEKSGRDQRGGNGALAQGSRGEPVKWTERNEEFVQRVRGARYADSRNYDTVYNTTMYVDRGIPAGYLGGCPPGLAKKSPACVPPGLARRQFVGAALPAYYAGNYIPGPLQYLYYDTPDYYYRWGDGYVYRVNRTTNLVAALLPLIGAGYGIGDPFPYLANPYYRVPSYYQSFYPDTPYDYYRYDSGYVYRIDAGTGYVEDVIPLLDRGYGVGQMLPVSYSYYNVPYQYRPLYYDTPDYYYRYAPGAIYQVDRGTQLITAIASLLTGGLSVGQPLPPAYSVYNVPMAYRPTYYDTPTAWYRYSDGYIYQVDPATQLITAMVRSVV